MSHDTLSQADSDIRCCTHGLLNA